MDVGVRRGFGFSANATTTRRMIARKAREREREQGGKEREFYRHRQEPELREMGV